MTDDIAVIIEGHYFACRVCAESLTKHNWPEKTFAVCKGETLLGFVSDHPCGEWTFVAAAECPALRHESITVIAEFIRLAESAWRRLNDMMPQDEAMIPFRFTATGLDFAPQTDITPVRQEVKP